MKHFIDVIIKCLQQIRIFAQEHNAYFKYLYLNLEGDIFGNWKQYYSCVWIETKKKIKSTTAIDFDWFNQFFRKQ